MKIKTVGLVLSLYMLITSLAFGAIIIKNASDVSTLATPVWTIEPANSAYIPRAYNSGFLDGINTTIVSMPAGTKVNIGQYIPQGAQGCILNVFGADIILNSEGELATGSIFVGVKVASGSYMKWDALCDTPNIWGATDIAVATTTLVCW